MPRRPPCHVPHRRRLTLTVAKARAVRTAAAQIMALVMGALGARAQVVTAVRSSAAFSGRSFAAEWWMAIIAIRGVAAAAHHLAVYTYPPRILYRMEFRGGEFLALDTRKNPPSLVPRASA